MFFRLAWRNIWRHKRRSLLTAFSIGFGVWLTMTFIGIGNSSYMQMIDNSVSLGFGHVSLLPFEYTENPSLKKSIVIDPQMLDRMRQFPEVRSVNQRIMGQAIAATAGKSFPAQFTAIDRKAEDIQNNILVKKIIKGSLFPEGSKNRCIIGSKLAEKLGLDIGKKFVYTTTSKTGDMTSGLLRVSGIFQTQAPEIDGFMILLPLEAVIPVIGYEENEVTVVSLTLHDNRKSDAIRDKIRPLMQDKNVETLAWHESQPDLAGFIQVDRGANQVFMIFIIILISLGILNTMLTAIMERRRELGILLAVGLEPRQLVLLITAEAVYICGLGIAIGCLLTLPTHLYFSIVGIDFSSMLENAASAGGSVYEPIMHSRIFLADVWATITIMIGLTILIALYPAIKASRVPPIQSIREMN